MQKCQLSKFKEGELEGYFTDPGVDNSTGMNNILDMGKGDDKALLLDGVDGKVEVQSNANSSWPRICRTLAIVHIVAGEFSSLICEVVDVKRRTPAVRCETSCHAEHRPTINHITIDGDDVAVRLI